MKCLSVWGGVREGDGEKNIYQYYNRKRGNCYPGKAAHIGWLHTELKSRGFW